MELVSTRDIGDKMWVHYRAKVLGIKPYIKGQKMSPNQYTPEDAELILNYNFIQHHSVRQYKSLEYILINRYRRLCDVASDLNISEKLARDLLDEYNRSGCLIVKSKL